MGVAPRDDVRIIRPAAILDERAANRVLDELKRLDISSGGVWNATSSLWQRYDTPWDGMGGTRGNARLLGSIAVMYDAPNRHQITIYKVTVTPYGLESSLERRVARGRRSHLGRTDPGHVSPRRARRPAAARPVQVSGDGRGSPHPPDDPHPQRLARVLRKVEERDGGHQPHTHVDRSFVHVERSLMQVTTVIRSRHLHTQAEECARHMRQVPGEVFATEALLDGLDATLARAPRALPPRSAALTQRR